MWGKVTKNYTNKESTVTVLANAPPDTETFGVQQRVGLPLDVIPHIDWRWAKPPAELFRLWRWLEDRTRGELPRISEPFGHSEIRDTYWVSMSGMNRTSTGGIQTMP
ncbi:hypothetical protein BT96DRAFT_1089065 [Gymnopus androsaceus JB14]|uniref:Uncharacterized protein n=1 Tax=Gymnopus androsaceus JB14 TaxID=1447944 RepID=A0A6A4GK59_9AGAR|nr:hypothetical protein BT96DRAFT_1089065 [Gymnopus androsaceus JB14]